MIKYKEIANIFVEKIKNGELRRGDRLPSEETLQRQFQVSRQTVRNAMQVLEIDGYISRRRGSGSYVLWEDIPRERTVGVLVAYMSSYIYPDIVRGIEQILTTKGYGMDLGLSHYSLGYERRYLTRMLEMNVSGVIVEGVKSALPNPNLDLYEELRRREIPVVFIHNFYNEFPATAILMEDEELSYQLTYKLIRAGHSRIMGCFKYDDVQGLKRYLGYARAMTENGFPFEENYVFWFGGFSMESPSTIDTYSDIPVFDDICRKIPEATALVCYNDLIAAGIIKKMNMMGYSVPEDISIVSFDDDIIQKETSICIVSAKHPKEALGREAAKEVMKQIARISVSGVSHNIYLPSEIAERPSIKMINEKGTV